MALPDKFPEGTEFAVWDDIPLSKTPDWVTTAWDTPEPRRFGSTRFIEASLVSEAKFRELVALAQAKFRHRRRDSSRTIPDAARPRNGGPKKN